MSDVERVGILMVHGIGQQTRYGHLEDEVGQIARALTEKAIANKWPAPVLRARSRSPDVRGATQAAWGSAAESPIVIELEMPSPNTSNGAVRRVDLHFHEVWWADLGDRPGAATLARFYGWALGMWCKPGLNQKQMGGQDRMRWATPEEGLPDLKKRLKYRLYLGLVALVVFMTIPLSLFARLVRWAFPTLPATVLAEYLGDVKLYQDQQRVGKSRVEDFGLPPRVSIRARMVDGLVAMATASYDRWYVCAHSLGSVVALNGLMETEQALPNYLDAATLALARGHGLVVDRASPPRSLNAGERIRMLPPRRAGLADTVIIDRNKLFANLRGLVTYGSPLERFRVLWPTIVPIHKEDERASLADKRAFRADMRWINLFDPTDPVASVLLSFDPKCRETHPEPENIPYRAGMVHLLSHISYLKLRKGPCAARALGDLLTDDAADWAKLNIGSMWRRVLQAVQYGCWLIILALGSVLVSALSVVTRLHERLRWAAEQISQFLSSAWWGAAGSELWQWLLDLRASLVAWSVIALTFVLVSGLLLWSLQKRMESLQESQLDRFAKQKGRSNGMKDRLSDPPPMGAPPSVPPSGPPSSHPPSSDASDSRYGEPPRPPHPLEKPGRPTQP